MNSPLNVVKGGAGVKNGNKGGFSAEAFLVFI